MIKSKPVLFLLLFIFAVSVCEYDCVAQEAPKTTTWIVVRHADRSGAKDELNDVGKNRAIQLRELAAVLRVGHIYSTDFVRTKSTAQPTADKLRLKVSLYKDHDQEALDKLKEKHKGDVVLIVGHSNTVGPIVNRLGGQGDFKVGHDDYDDLFVLKSDDKTVQAMRLKYGK